MVVGKEGSPLPPRHTGGFFDGVCPSWRSAGGGLFEYILFTYILPDYMNICGWLKKKVFLIFHLKGLLARRTVENGGLVTDRGRDGREWPLQVLIQNRWIKDMLSINITPPRVKGCLLLWIDKGYAFN